MATMTAAEKEYIRAYLPTYAITDPAYVTDAQLQYLYDNKAGSDLDRVIALSLRQMCIKLSHLVARSNTATGDTIQSQQERQAVCAAAAEWGASTGISGGVLEMGTIDLRLDTDADDTEYSEADS